MTLSGGGCVGGLGPTAAAGGGCDGWLGPGRTAGGGGLNTKAAAGGGSHTMKGKCAAGRSNVSGGGTGGKRNSAGGGTGGESNSAEVVGCDDVWTLTEVARAGGGGGMGLINLGRVVAMDPELADSTAFDGASTR
jgi:hypothetical protein